MLDDWGTVFRHVILIPGSVWHRESVGFRTRPGRCSGARTASEPAGAAGTDGRNGLSILQALCPWRARAASPRRRGLWIKLTSRGAAHLPPGARRRRRAQPIDSQAPHHAYGCGSAVDVGFLIWSPQARPSGRSCFKLKKDPRVLPGVGNFLRQHQPRRASAIVERAERGNESGGPAPVPSLSSGWLRAAFPRSTEPCETWA